MSEEKPKRDRTRKGGSRKPTGSLVDLRYVYKFPKNGKESEGRTMLRKLKEEDPKAFMQLLTSAERHHRSIAEASRGEGKAGADVGSERSLQAFAGMLADWDAKQVG